jgi:hypothetical protein
MKLKELETLANATGHDWKIIKPTSPIGLETIVITERNNPRVWTNWSVKHDLEGLERYLKKRQG